ncbi:MAG: hypothetical protein HY211_08340 [Candidatus Omnitrophica bacterium]|nr:hypothetical protein [Candidatus Omnitrophota bacterium]
MNNPSDEKLNEMLRQAYPSVEVSPDFTLRLWRRLMKTARPPWMIPVPVAALAVGVGLLAGIWSWSSGVPEHRSLMAGLSRVERMDLFGNAPLDSVAGSFLTLTREGEGA